jgi:hypothetical protein
MEGSRGQGQGFICVGCHVPVGVGCAVAKVAKLGLVSGVVVFGVGVVMRWSGRWVAREIRGYAERMGGGDGTGVVTGLGIGKVRR